eukprot:364417-Chlamydomonas_euryale.AAC.8
MTTSATTTSTASMNEALGRVYALSRGCTSLQQHTQQGKQRLLPGSQCLRRAWQKPYPTRHISWVTGVRGGGYKRDVQCITCVGCGNYMRDRECAMCRHASLITNAHAWACFVRHGQQGDSCGALVQHGIWAAALEHAARGVPIRNCCCGLKVMELASCLTDSLRCDVPQCEPHQV